MFLSHAKVARGHTQQPGEIPGPWLLMTTLWIAFCIDMTAAVVQNLDKSFPHIEHCAKVTGRVGLVTSFPVLMPDFTCISVVSSPSSNMYFFTSATV